MFCLEMFLTSLEYLVHFLVKNKPSLANLVVVCLWFLGLFMVVRTVHDRGVGDLEYNFSSFSYTCVTVWSH